MASTIQLGGGGKLVRELVQTINHKSYDIDIKSILPSLWQQLTVDNFSIETNRISYAVRDSAFSHTANSAPMSYDQSTGILKTGTLAWVSGNDYVRADTRNVYVYYVK